MPSVDRTQAVPVCRPLGAWEKIFWLHDRAHPLHFALTAQIRGRFSVPQLQQALTLAQQRHPLLRVRIAVDEAEQPWFVEDSACIPLLVVARQSEQHWQREVEREIATAFDWSQAPLVRVVLVHSSNGAELSELIVTCHHSIADGISVTYLIRDILQAIATPTAFGQSLSVPPAREDLVPVQAPETISLLKPMPKFRRMSGSFKVVQPARQNNRLYVSSGSLSPETTQSLMSRCRQEQTSVHAAICGAFLLAIRHQNHSEQSQNLTCTSSINLRPYLTSVNQEDVSLCAVAERTFHLLRSDTNLWDLARSVKHQLNQSMASDKLFERIFQGQEWMSTNPSPDVVLQIFKDQWDYDVCISNLTRLMIQQQFGEVELQAIYGPVVTTGVENERFVGVATLGERLFFTLVCSELVMLRSQSKTLHEEAIHLLSCAIK
ncbi:phthiocerol/phthiodiolone dimycocerosyl transferase family protein [Microcoleus sp. D3_18_C4]|uniref:phthiocerol/phthiodiolone dimycocerosyl transferase family protein n=1 Tax=Microcoleus sp. D3_18_C4 TaxID=3055335 RepID=UPI002FD4C19C